MGLWSEGRAVVFSVLSPTQLFWKERSVPVPSLCKLPEGNPRAQTSNARNDGYTGSIPYTPLQQTWFRGRSSPWSSDLGLSKSHAVRTSLRTLDVVPSQSDSDRYEHWCIERMYNTPEAWQQGFFWWRRWVGWRGDDSTPNGSVVQPELQEVHELRVHVREQVVDSGGSPDELA